MTGTLNYGGVALSAGGVIFATGTSDGYVYALNSKNGEVLWQYKNECCWLLSANII